jgi:tRNA(fMet)-specific endonuclease VapC
MSLQFLLDTAWVIDYLHGEPKVTKRVSTELRRRTLGLSIVSVAELYEGVYRSDDTVGTERAVTQFIRGVPAG